MAHAKYPFVKADFILCLGLMAIAVSGCGKAQTSAQNAVATVLDTVSNNTAPAYQCTFTELDRFNVANDPTQNFSAANVSVTGSVLNNNCVGVSNGVVGNGIIDTVSRTDGLISMIGSGTSDSISISGSQATIPATDLQACSSGVQGTGTLTNVELDAVSGQIRVYIFWKVIVNGCTHAAIANGQSDPAPIISEPFSVPTSVSSAPFYLSVESDPGQLGSSFKQWNYSNTDSYFRINPIVGQPNSFSISNPTTGEQWQIGFFAPGNGLLSPGTYANIGSQNTGSVTKPSMSIYGPTVNGYQTGYPINGGSFTILTASYDSFGNILKFEATFTAINDTRTGALLRGVFRYDTTQSFADYQPPADTTSPYLLYLRKPTGPNSFSTLSYDQTQGTFTGNGQYVSGGSVGLSYSAANGITWQLRFKFPDGVLPQIGHYGAQGGAIAPVEGGQGANIYIFSANAQYDCSASNIINRFDVTEIQYDSNGVLKSFAANFEQNCNFSSTPISGTIRYNQPASTTSYSGPSDLTSLDLLYLQSGSGDYIGQGKTLNLTDGQGNFTSSVNGSGVSVNYRDSSNPLSEYWSLVFWAPGNGYLQPGVYLTTSTPGASHNAPYLSISGEGRGCNISVGQFEVIKANYDSNGNLIQFEANFSQYCDWNAVPLQGTIRLGLGFFSSPP